MGLGGSEEAKRHRRDEGEHNAAGAGGTPGQGVPPGATPGAQGDDAGAGAERREGEPKGEAADEGDDGDDDDAPAAAGAAPGVVVAAAEESEEEQGEEMLSRSFDTWQRCTLTGARRSAPGSLLPLAAHTRKAAVPCSRMSPPRSFPRLAGPAAGGRVSTFSFELFCAIFAAGSGAVRPAPVSLPIAGRNRTRLNNNNVGAAAVASADAPLVCLRTPGDLPEETEAQRKPSVQERAELSCCVSVKHGRQDPAAPSVPTLRRMPPRRTSSDAAARAL